MLPHRRLILALVLLLAACASHRISTSGGIAEPFGRDFIDFPDKYRGRVVRLSGLQVARAELVRPLVFTPPGEELTEVVVSDGRSLAARAHLTRGQQVTIIIECTEGRTDRGNLLVAIESSPPSG